MLAYRKSHIIPGTCILVLTQSPDLTNEMPRHHPGSASVPAVFIGSFHLALYSASKLYIICSILIIIFLITGLLEDVGGKNA